MQLSELKHKRVVLAGMGVNHRRLAEFLKQKGVGFAVVDGWKEPDELVGKLKGFEVIFRTPGLPYRSRPIQSAIKRGLVVYSQTKLFFDLCPCPIVGVTGTKGKGTTASLVARILQAQGQKVWLSGNIGHDPFEFYDELTPRDTVVLELSSFQLEDLHKSPHVAVVLKIYPEHLNYHETFDDYLAAKVSILKHQTPADFAVLNFDESQTRALAKQTPAAILWNSTTRELNPGCFVSAQDEIVLAARDETYNIMKTAEVKLLGRFNLENVTAAIAAAAALGATDRSLIRRAVMGFDGLPHRLELAAEINRVKFYDDSFATTPETTIAALSAFKNPVILIIGGSEKNSDYGALAKIIAKSTVKALLPIGTTGPRIADLARRAGYRGRVVEANLKDMKTIVAQASSLAEKGDAVLLSPAAASFDMFTDYKHRGELFQKFAKRAKG